MDAGIGCFGIHLRSRHACCARGQVSMPDRGCWVTYIGRLNRGVVSWASDEDTPVATALCAGAYLKDVAEMRSIIGVLIAVPVVWWVFAVTLGLSSFPHRRRHPPFERDRRRRHPR